MNRLKGKERYEFESRLLAGAKRSKRLVLREILEFAAGKASCWPTNDRIGERVGLKRRAVQYVLRALEADRTIMTLADTSGGGNRLIVLLGHPGAREAVQAFSSRGAKSSPPGVQGPARKPVQGGAGRIPKAKREKNPGGVSPAGEPAATEEKSPVFDRIFGRILFGDDGSIL